MKDKKQTIEIEESKTVQLMDFQDVPSEELADMLNSVAKIAREVYGEKLVSKFIYLQAHNYRMGILRDEWYLIQEMVDNSTQNKETEEQEEETDPSNTIVH